MMDAESEKAVQPMEQQKQEITLAVAERIRSYRHLRGLSQEALALQAGLNPAYFGQVERGLKCPTVDTLYRIARALDVSLSELLRLDAAPLLPEDSRRQRFLELCARVPAGKLDRFLSAMEDLARLL